MVFEGTTGVYERSYHFNSKWQERKRNMRIGNGFEFFFCFCSNLSDENIISAKGQAWKQLWILEVCSENGCGKLHYFWSEIGSGFAEPGGPPQPRIPRKTHPGFMNACMFVSIHSIENNSRNWSTYKGMNDFFNKGTGRRQVEHRLGQW